MQAAAAEELEQRLDWLRRVESMDEAVARRELRPRLRSDALRARSETRIPEPWPSMTPTVLKMLERDGELVRLHRIVDTLPAESRILDVGCGPGVVGGTLALHGRVASYLGIDLSEPKVASARDMAATNRLGDHLRFAVGDARELPADTIAELAPDTVLILEVLEHLQDPADVLSAIADLVPDDATITFSVPILGRIEACWGHRTLYGADAIVGLADACGLRLLDVDEVHNTWALATVTRQYAPPQRTPLIGPVPIHHVVASRIAATGVEASALTGPLRLQLNLPAGTAACLEADTPGADWIRFDMEVTPPGSLRGCEIATLDADGDVVRRWTPDLAGPASASRTTIVVRPRDAPPPVTTASSLPSRTRVFLEAGVIDTEVTVWRLGFAAGYELLNDRVEPIWATTMDAPEAPVPQRTHRVITGAVRRLGARWPRVGRPLARLMRRG